MVDPYLIPGSDDVLRNKLGLTTFSDLEEAEYEIAEVRSARLFRAHTGGRPFQVSMQAWRTVHKTLFGPVYDWAGQYRTIFITKPNSRGLSRFTSPDRIKIEGDRGFAQLAATLKYVGRKPIEKIQDGLADAYAALNEVHPFREGNGRSQKVLFSLIARDQGMEIDWSAIPTDEHNLAAVEASHDEMDRMRRHFRDMCRILPKDEIALRLSGERSP